MLRGENRVVRGLDKGSQGEFHGPFTFVQLADSQLGMLESMKRLQWVRTLNALSLGLLNFPVPEDLSPEIAREHALEREAETLQRAVDAVNAMDPPPAFVVVCGDLVNTFPSSAAKHQAEVARFKAVMAGVRADVPLVCLCGNHDVGDRPTAATVQTFTTNFGDDYFVFWVRGVRFIVVNSQLYKQPGQCEELASAQDQWLRQELDKGTDGAKHTVVFSHIPPFISRADEGAGYFNLLGCLPDGLLDAMGRAGVSKWFAGHYHRNAGGWLRWGDEARCDLEVVVTAAVGTNITPNENGDALDLSGMAGVVLSDEYSGFRVVEVSEHAITHRWCSLASLRGGS